MYVDIKPPVTKAPVQDLSLNWRAVLYHGDTDKHLPLGVTAYDQELQETLV